MCQNMVQNVLGHSSPRQQQLEALREVGAGRYRQERKGLIRCGSVCVPCEPNGLRKAPTF